MVLAYRAKAKEQTSEEAKKRAPKIMLVGNEVVFTRSGTHSKRILTNLEIDNGACWISSITATIIERDVTIWNSRL